MTQDKDLLVLIIIQHMQSMRQRLLVGMSFNDKGEKMTFSIIAYNNDKTEYGIAICSAIPFIGKYSAFVYPNLCVIAAQGKVDPSTAHTVRNCLKDNMKESEILSYLEKIDPSYQRKQLALLNLKTQKFTGYTGIDLKSSKNEYSEIFGNIIVDENFIISGNCLISLNTLEKMRESFVLNSNLNLDLRILEALKAGNSTQGDFRGRQSASFYYYKVKEEYPFRTIDVDEHTDPVNELERIFHYATTSWQYVVDYCFFDMKFDRKYKSGSDFPKEVMQSINKLGKPVSERD